MFKETTQVLGKSHVRIIGMVVVQLPNPVWLLATPWTAAWQASLSLIISQSLPKFMSIKSVMPPNHLILCCLLLLLPSIYPSIRVFSNELMLCISWPKYWSFSFSISPPNAYSGFISFKIDWFALLSVLGTLKSLLQHYSSKTSILWCYAFFMAQFSHLYMAARRTVKWSESHSVLSDSLQPHGLYTLWNSPSQNTGVGTCSFLQVIFPTQGLNPGLPCCRGILYQLSHQGSSIILEWAAYPFSSRSFWPRNWIRVSCIAGWFLLAELPGKPQKTIALSTCTFLCEVISLPFNALSMFVIAFLPRSKHLLITWLQSPSAVILEPKQRKSAIASTFPLLSAMMVPKALTVQVTTICRKFVKS